MMDLLQVSLLINIQTGGKKEKKREEKGGGERDLWTTRSENEARHSLSFPFPSLFFFLSPVCLLIKSETWSKSTAMKAIDFCLVKKII